MKKFLLLLMFPALAHAESDFDFQSGNNSYKLFESSVVGYESATDLIVIALWEMSQPQDMMRVKAIVSGCKKPFGSVTFSSQYASNVYDWSFEGGRVYDRMAAATCFAYWSKNLNPKRSK